MGDISTPAMSAAILDIFKREVERHNNEEAEVVARLKSKHPDEDYESEFVTLESVAAAFMSSDYDGLSDLLASQIKGHILDIANEGQGIDPWPELTRSHLRLLVGGRPWPRLMTDSDRRVLRYALEARNCEDQPFNTGVRLVAARYRDWLEKDIGKRLRELAEARALIAAVDGRAG